MNQKKKMSGIVKALIVLAAVVVVGISYYFVIVRGLGLLISAYDVTIENLDSQIVIETAKAVQLPNKQAAIEECKDLGSTVQIYDNNKEEQVFLSNLMKAYDKSSSFAFSDPVLSGDYVKREVNITFTAENYSDAEKILNAIKNCEYRNVIGNVTLKASETRTDDLHGGLENKENEVEVTIQLTFIETIYGSEEDTSDLKTE